MLLFIKVHEKFGVRWDDRSGGFVCVCVYCILMYTLRARVGKNGFLFPKDALLFPVCARFIQSAGDECVLRVMTVVTNCLNW